MKNCTNCINTQWFDECTEQADMSNVGVGCLFWKGEQKTKYAPIPKEEIDWDIVPFRAGGYK